MFQKLITYSIHNKLVVGVATLALIVWGDAVEEENEVFLLSSTTNSTATSIPHFSDNVLAIASFCFFTVSRMNGDETDR